MVLRYYNIKINICYKAIVVIAIDNWHTNRHFDQWKRLESLEKDECMLEIGI